MVFLDRLRVGQFVTLADIQEGPDGSKFALPEGLVDGALAQVIIADRGGIVVETKDRRRFTFNAVALLPNVAKSDLTAWPEDKPVKQEPVGPPSL
ncbi:MAG TPA: hypothetical protein VG125_10520 [Pirellulales bacterium]|jgi:hypothetical protein|nr:hypothetical protein [Pirellulales bacterium]